MKCLRANILSVSVGLLALACGSAAAQAMSAAPPAVKHASVNGVDLVYLEQGQGAPVVFVHGAFSDHRAWEGQREAVAQRHRYIALTQRYFGTAPWPDSGEKYSLATHADDLAVFIRELKAGPVRVVGWSYGGAIAQPVPAENSEFDLPKIKKQTPVGNAIYLFRIRTGETDLSGNVIVDDVRYVAQDVRRVASGSCLRPGWKRTAEGAAIGEAIQGLIVRNNC